MKKELEQAYNLLSPYSNKSRWEFENHLTHLKTITRHLSHDYTVFDAGCGIGIIAMALKLMGYKIEGSDKYLFEKNNSYSIKDINKLKKIWKQNNLEIKNLDILDVNKEYDFVISIATIEHQSKPKQFLKKLTKITKNEGYIYLATPNVTNLLNRMRFLFGRAPLGNIEEFYTENDFVGHWREYTIKELEKMFELEHIKIIESKTEQQIKPEFSLQILKNFRRFYLNIFRLLACILPGTGEANIILGKVQK